MCGLFSGNIKIEEAWVFFPKGYSSSKLKNINESKNIKNGCNILKILNKIIIFLNMFNINRTVKKRILNKKEFTNYKNEKIFFFLKKSAFKVWQNGWIGYKHHSSYIRR